MSRTDPIFRDVGLFIDEALSPQARSAYIARAAGEIIDDVRASNRSITGRDDAPEIIVDGKVGAPLASVRPDGTIIANFDPLLEVLEWIGEQLLLASPRLTGKYMQSHVLKADGVEVPIGTTIPPAADYQFMNKQPYARKIEPQTVTVRRGVTAEATRRRRNRITTRSGDGQSQQAPDGVYLAVAAMAAKRFGAIARIRYSSHGWDNYNPETGYVHPSIDVRAL